MSMQQQIYHDQEISQNQQQFLDQNPPIDVLNKPYSLQPDILTGWQPKLKILGPIPFNFDNRVVDDIIDQLTSFGSKYQYRVIYLGFRHQSSFKMHQDMKKDYNFKHQAIINSNFSHMAAYFRKFHAHFRAKFSRLFRGMNPTLRPNQQIFFDSNFQSGNLDAAIKIKQNQFDLFMRIDTNTRGHVQWFNFKIKNAGYKKIKINICNFRRHKTLYARGMKPYIFSQNLQKKKGIGWHQGGQKVKYEKRQLRYKFLQEFYYPEAITFNFLHFQYNFLDDFEQVHFAYCPPFSYSDNVEMIKELKMQNNQIINNSEKQKKQQEQADQKQKQFQIIKQQILCESLGGLDLVLLTITDFSIDAKFKKCILISARIHPGQTCGSYMVKGFLKYICSNHPNAKQLRKKVVFKVIPMLNPDGVVAGNFRTSLNGRDLNRAFRNSIDLLIPEVKALKQLVFQLKKTYQNRLIFFLDFHGHSVKKNVFLYGPQYEIWQPNYYRTRIFPRILSSKTEMFRYYSCLFRVATFKRSTARAVILRNVPHCYTIEASTGCYYSNQDKKDIPFTPDDWILMGKYVGQGITDYIDIFYSENIKGLDRNKRINQLKTMKGTIKKNDKKVNEKFQTRVLTTSKTKKNQQKRNDKINEYQNVPLFPQKAQKIIDQLKIQEEQRKNKILQKEDYHQSDQYSQGGSDSEGSSDDIPDQELQILHAQILDSMKQFRQKFYNVKQKGDPFRQAQQKKKQMMLDAKKMKNNTKKVQVIASLRKKVQMLNNQKNLSNNDSGKERSLSPSKGRPFFQNKTPILQKGNNVIIGIRNSYQGYSKRSSNVEIGNNSNVNMKLSMNVISEIKYNNKKSFQVRNKLRLTQDIFKFYEKLENHDNFGIKGEDDINNSKDNNQSNKNDMNIKYEEKYNNNDSIMMRTKFNNSQNIKNERNKLVSQNSNIQYTNSSNKTLKKIDKRYSIKQQ